MTYNYNLENFLITPFGTDKRLFIYDKNNVFVDSIITDISHYFVKNNCLVIKITNKNDLILSFESREVAKLALEKLDLYRKNLMVTNDFILRPNRPTFNTMNRNMLANITVTDGDLALNTVVQQQPTSRVEVIVRGSSHISCGYPDGSNIGCYFTSVTDAGDPTKARINDGDVMLGDQLYWIGSIANFNLDDTDYLDFDFLI
jgi:hypothetical protein